jgi:hypothetical protein
MDEENPASCRVGVRWIGRFAIDLGGRVAVRVHRPPLTVYHSISNLQLERARCQLRKNVSRVWIAPIDQQSDCSPVMSEHDR